MGIAADHFNPQDEHNGVALSADLHLKGALHKRSREPSSERLKYRPLTGSDAKPRDPSAPPSPEKKSPLAPFPVRAGWLGIGWDYQK